ncbi:MAG: c-type cytochrome biogenesis protein CcsB [Chitinispirillaceae bacterium]|nr:c-type cytochrome biogenesis protein CcsB [Chitinispirillaceae bacterium]
METLLSTDFLYIAFAAYGCALAVSLADSAFDRRTLARISLACMGLAVASHTGGLVMRAIEFGHFPVANMYEYMLFLAWCAALCYFPLEGLVKNRVVSTFAIVVIVLLMLIVSLLPKEGSASLMPALRSYWLHIHVSATAAGEGLFAIGFSASVLHLVKRLLPPHARLSRLHAKIPPLAQLDTVAYRCIVPGYVLFTLGALFAGAIWADRAWGSFWSWDPKETSSLVVWIIYCAYLHLRAISPKNGSAIHILSIAGFLAALLTFFASMILGGLHSYG